MTVDCGIIIIIYVRATDQVGDRRLRPVQEMTVIGGRNGGWWPLCGRGVVVCRPGMTRARYRCRLRRFDCALERYTAVIIYTTISDAPVCCLEGQRVSSFLTAHQHIIGYSVP